MRPKAFTSSRAAMGKNARAKPVPYILAGSMVRPNIWDNGGRNSTQAIRMMDTKAARFSFWLVKIPVWNRDLADLMLKAWRIWL